MKYKHFLLAALLFAGFNNATGQTAENPFYKQLTVACTPVKDQGNTGTCWSFSTTSFLESELIKNGKKTPDLSEMYAVRKIYLEKGEKYIRYHGLCNFSQGALAHDLVHAYKKYGAMPESVYSGKPNGERHNHELMEKELKNYLDTILSKKVIDPHWKNGFEAILDKHLGEVPAVFKVDNTQYNAISYANSQLGLQPDDYISFTSFSHHPYNEAFILEVPDNWSNGFFYNVALPDLMQIMQYALQKGYTVEWDGDVSEPGFRPDLGIAMFVDKKSDLQTVNKLPKEKLTTASSRQAGFDNHTTTDDHLMHITGIYNDPDGNAFFAVKNSWGAKSGFEGFIYMSDLYMQMKTISIMVNKNAIPGDIKNKLGL